MERIFNGIFRDEYPVILLNCCLIIIDNVFKDIFNVCKSRYSGADIMSYYNRLVSNVSLWSDDLYEKELINLLSVSYTHLRAHETKANLVCRLLLEKKKDEN